MASNVRIDGRILEGGGQVLRVAISSAVVLRKQVTVYNIRAGRPKPGLAAQHLKGLELVASLCGGNLKGGHVNSTEVSLIPRDIRHGLYHCDTKTAGSVTLLLQAALPCALFARGSSNLVLLGGTNADFAPPIDYTQHVFAPVASRFGVHFSCDVIRRGFYPRGGGEIRVHIEGLEVPITPVSLLERGQILSIAGVCYTAGLPPRLAGTAIEAAVKCIRSRLARISKDIPVEIRQETVPDAQFTGKGFGIVLWSTTDTGLVLGSSQLSSLQSKKGSFTPADQLGLVAAEELCDEIESGVCVDKQMQNQVIILMGLAAGESSVLCGPLSLHTRTAIEVMQQTTSAKFEVEPMPGQLFKITCQGIGLDPRSPS